MEASEWFENKYGGKDWFIESIEPGKLGLWMNENVICPTMGILIKGIDIDGRVKYKGGEHFYLAKIIPYSA
jgi:hypothetical protein